MHKDVSFSIKEVNDREGLKYQVDEYLVVIIWMNLKNNTLS